MSKMRQLLDIEQQLADDADGSGRAALLANLNGLAARLAGRRRQLNPRDIDRQLAAAQAAVQGAIDAVCRIQLPAWAHSARNP